MIQVLVASGYGINCEKEMASACHAVGMKTTMVHAQRLVTADIVLENYDMILFPGGFSFGDELGAGKVFANRIRHAKVRLRDKLLAFVERGKCIFGVCNGFQLLVKLGLLPGTGKMAALAHNREGRFVDRWVHHRVNQSSCIFTKGLSHLYLPVRHGEGRLVMDDPKAHVAMQYATNDGQAANLYPDNPNGSQNSVAALTDSSGRILGMMAHPESAIYFVNDPRAFRIREAFRREGKIIPRYGDGYALFYNAIQYLKGTK